MDVVKREEIGQGNMKPIIRLFLSVAKSLIVTKMMEIRRRYE